MKSTGMFRSVRTTRENSLNKKIAVIGAGAGRHVGGILSEDKGATR